LELPGGCVDTGVALPFELMECASPAPAAFCTANILRAGGAVQLLTRRFGVDAKVDANDVGHCHRACLRSHRKCP
jgi:hypothetical protein